MKVLICGDRYWDDFETMLNRMRKLPSNTIIVNGDAKGADQMSTCIAYQLGKMKVKRYPANWKKWGRAAGPLRNQEMLDDNLDICLVLAFHKDIDKSRGTKDMVRRASKIPIQVEIITGENK
jgi:hypothetical protein